MVLHNFARVNSKKGPSITYSASYSMGSCPLAQVISFPSARYKDHLITLCELFLLFNKKEGVDEQFPEVVGNTHYEKLWNHLDKRE